MIRTYSELIRLSTFQERLDYLMLHGAVGEDTFGFDRWLNQKFYRSVEWKQIRNYVIVRDTHNQPFCCDLGIEDVPILGQIYVHHMNPLSKEDISNSTDYLLNPEYLICASLDTHNAIHYGYLHLRQTALTERKPNDTSPWKV